MEFSYYYGTEADQFSFIRIPKVMLTNEKFKELSLPAKVLYGLLLDRMNLSMKNHWMDDEKRVFIIYQIADIQEDLGFSKKKAIEYLAELEEFGLVEKRRRGFGLPSIIFVKNFVTENMSTSRSVEMGTSGGDGEINKISELDSKRTEPEGFIPDFDEINGENCTRGVELGTSRSVEMGTSRGVEMDTSGGVHTGSSEVPVWEPLKSNNKYNNTDVSNTESNQIVSMIRSDGDVLYRNYLAIVKNNLEYDLMLERYPYDKERIDGVVDLIIEVLLSQSKEILISSEKYPAEMVKAKMLKIDSGHLEYVMDCMDSNTTKIRNIKKYLLATLFNAPTTISGYYKAEVNHDMPQLARRN